MKIEAVFYPTVLINNGVESGYPEGRLTEHHAKDFKSRPHVNDAIELNHVTGKYEIIGNNVNVDCPGGACPLK